MIKLIRNLSENLRKEQIFRPKGIIMIKAVKFMVRMIFRWDAYYLKKMKKKKDY